MPILVLSRLVLFCVEINIREESLTDASAELSVDVSVADVLNAASITHLIEQAYARLSSSI